MIQNQGIMNVVKYHKYNIVVALQDLFPNIGLVPSKFGVSRNLIFIKM